LIVNQLKNKSFRTTAEYVLGKEEVELLDSNMLGATPRQMSAEVAACRRYRPNLQQATLHVIFSLPYRKDEQGEITYQEDLPDEKAVELVTQWREAMQVTNCLYFLARHRDRTHNHFHLVACRIRKDGSVVDDSWDYRRSEVVVRQLEKEFNLEPTACSNERVAFKVQEIGIETTVGSRRAPTSKQKHHPSSQPTVKQRLANLIDEACSDSPTVKQLIGRLQHQGVKVHPQFSTRGLFKEAIAFELEGVKVAGNKLGSAYSFPGLLRKRGVSYSKERDLPALEAAAAGKVVSLHAPSPREDTNQLPSTQISSGLYTFEPSTLIQDEEQESWGAERAEGAEGAEGEKATHSPPAPLTSPASPALFGEPTPITGATPLAAYLQLFELLFDQQEPSVAFAEATIAEAHLTPPSTSKPKPPEPIPQDRLQAELAQKLYPDVAQVWNRYKKQSKKVPTRAGVARVLKGNNYALICDSGSSNLWIVHRQRGTLAQYKDGKVELANRITPEDLANFSQIAAAQQQPPPKAQQQSQMEL
jgi:hypothetical protein